MGFKYIVGPLYTFNYIQEFSEFLGPTTQKVQADLHC